MNNSNGLKTNRSYLQAFLLTAAAASAVAVLCLTMFFRFGYINPNYSNREKLISLDQGWTVSDGSGNILAENASLPYTADSDNSELNFSRQLYISDPHISAFLFDNSRQPVSVYLDDEEIYSINTSGMYRYLAATGLNMVRLSYDKDAVLNIKLLQPGNNHFCLNTISGGSISIVNTEIFLYDLPTILNFFTLALITVILFFSYVYLKFKHVASNSIPLLLLFSFSVIVWGFTDSTLVNLTPLRVDSAAIIEYTMFPFIPIPFIMYSMLLYSRPHNALKLLIPLGYLISLIRIAGAAFGIAKLNETTFLAIFYIFFSIIICMYCFENEKELHKEQFNHILFAGLGMSFAFTLIIMLACSVNNGSLYRSLALTASSFLFIDLAVISVYSNVTSAQRVKRDRELLKVLESEVHTDSLTGLGNRHAFDDAVEVISENPSRHADAVLIMFDLNKLKYVNDNYGHDAGDELIFNAAKCISKTIGNTPGTKSFRLGGDEFTVIYNDRHHDLEEQLNGMQLWMNQHNLTAEYELSMAYGISRLKTADGSFLSPEAWKQEADVNMYNNKNKRRKKQPAQLSAEYQHILHHILSGMDDPEACRRDLETNLGRIYDPEIGRLLLDNWDIFIKILLQQKNN